MAQRLAENADISVLLLEAGGSDDLSDIMGSDVRPTVVLVHGGFVDGAGWEGVYRILKKAN